ncbi:MAG: class I SAM-dependent RNA methyltransferase [Oligoflexales bacterium]|nr:class I SAM-dependent RNA methyltransferase [Oligoflexales bacterium]
MINDALALSKLNCEHSRYCSGCPKIRLVHAKQSADKQKYLANLFSPLMKKHQIDLQDLMISPKLGQYRFSSKLSTHRSNQGEIAIGLYKKDTKVVLDIANCQVHLPPINRLVQKLFRTNVLPFNLYNHQKKSFQTNCLKFITLRYSPHFDEFGVVLSHSGISKSTFIDWIVGAKIGKKISVYENLLMSDASNMILSNKTEHIYGERYLNFQILGREFQLHPATFTQANADLVDSFTQYITMDLNGDVLLDLYGGFGVYSTALHKNFIKIYLVDSAQAAQESALASIALNKIKNIIFEQKSCEKFLHNILQSSERDKISHIIVNPPRAGLTQDVLAKLGKKEWKNLKGFTYVSCNPETLKRDLEVLTKNSRLKITSIRGFDMFPNTEHLETVVKGVFI